MCEIKAKKEFNSIYRVLPFKKKKTPQYIEYCLRPDWYQP